MGRSLASPFEVMASLKEAVVDPASLIFSSRQWAHVSVVELAFGSAGSFTAAPLAYYSISTFTGADSYLASEGGDARRPPRLPQGATLIQQVGTGSHYVWTQPHTARMACLDPTIVEKAAVETGMVNPSRIDIPSSFYERDPVCEHLVAALAEQGQLGHHVTQQFLVDSIASALAMRLLARASTFRPRPSPKGGLSAAAVRRIRVYVHEHVGDVSLDALAALSGVSRFHFARQFRASTGESPMGYVRRMRIERAKERLSAEQVHVADIAASLGFADQSHFSRTFKRVTGVSPMAFAASRRL